MLTDDIFRQMLSVRKMYSVSLIADGDDLQEFINTLLLRSYKLQEFIDNSDLSTLHFYKLNSVNYATYSAYYGTVKLVVI